MSPRFRAASAPPEARPETRNELRGRSTRGKNFTQIDLDKGLRTAQSPALLAMGLGLLAAGAALVFANWSYILSVTKNSVAASLLALMCLALVYASREVRLSAARSAA